MQLECDLTDYIGRAPEQRVALDKALDDHVRQSGLMPQNMALRSWLMQRPAIFEVDGHHVNLTQQSIEHERHLEAQFVSFLQHLGRPAHVSKDIAPFCKKHNIEMRVSILLIEHLNLWWLSACLVSCFVALQAAHVVLCGAGSSPHDQLVQS